MGQHRNTLQATYRRPVSYVTKYKNTVPRAITSPVSTVVTATKTANGVVEARDSTVCPRYAMAGRDNTSCGAWEGQALSSRVVAGAKYLQYACLNKTSGD